MSTVIGIVGSLSEAYKGYGSCPKVWSFISVDDK